MGIIERLLPAFPDAVVIRELPDGSDRVRGDRELSPHCGFISDRESEKLFEIAQQFPGIWCEIGSHVGWSASVIAGAGSHVVLVDPEYSFEDNGVRIAPSPVYSRMAKNMAGLEISRRSMPIGLRADDFFRTNNQMFDGFLIDGDHDSPSPLNDAKNALNYLNPRGAIVLHDYSGQPIKDAVVWLAEMGMAVEIFEGMQGLAICRRGK